ncbi:uncharacterized protein DUF4270 [Pedobacter psychrotolerans]|uniref:Uncharacterized protein DUF4270 n=1 Tax=Pedobacter psychrotolerans TaxID=1843235 RepID=A0A4R2HAT0_9SPHI|nr:DUF4270 domain-containing protein [Pedobacter psychrotolerans]TCO23902.1 uncharacterized protein DUF4270 [Pedobacter psychrotolerans]GGE63475.1 hypothetical protein GCM10011413_32340 [Pedobacter psychrotolerans]
MKFTKQDLLTLLISLFLFASCKNPGAVGLDVDPNAAIEGTLVNSERITSQTIKENDIATNTLTQHPIGYMVDPTFGKTEASLAMTVNPPSTLTQDFGTNSTLDSAVLVLNIGTQFYGDTTTSKYSIDVYQLTNRITNFKSSDVQAHNSTLLGNFNSKIFPKTPIKITDVVSSGKDTVKTVKAQIRIPLNKAFIQNTILAQPAATFTTNAKFAEYFKGLYAEINKTSSTIAGGGVAFIDFAASNSYVQMVYKKPNTSNGIDTVSVNFPISTASSAVTANIKHDYTGTDIQTQISNPATQYNVTYLQALVGVKTKISFPDLANFTNTYGKVVVNKAELVVDLSTGSFTNPFAPAEKIGLYRWDIAEQPADLPDYTNLVSSGGEALFGGAFDSTKNRYVFSVTSYVQGLIDKTITDYGTFLAPTSTSEFQITPSATSAGRSVIGSFGNTPNKIKLNIYYTKIN